MKRVGLVLLPVVLLVSGCATTEPPTLSVFTLPLRDAPRESDITRLDGRAQAAIVNNLAEMGDGNPIGFLETIASPVFRGEAGQDQQDLSKVRLRLVFSVQNPLPSDSSPSWIKITLKPRAGQFLTWTRLVSESEEIDLEQLRFQNHQSSRRLTTTSVSLAGKNLTIVRKGRVLGSFAIDAEVDLERGKEISIGKLSFRPRPPEPSLIPEEEERDGAQGKPDPTASFSPVLRRQTIHLPKMWSLMAEMEVSSDRHSSPHREDISLVSSHQIDFTLWTTRTNNGTPVALDGRGGHVYFTSYQEATEILELKKACIAGDGTPECVLQSVSAESLSAPEKESAK